MSKNSLLEKQLIFRCVFQSYWFIQAAVKIKKQWTDKILPDFLQKQIQFMHISA